MIDELSRRNDCGVRFDNAVAKVLPRYQEMSTAEQETFAISAREFLHGEGARISLPINRLVGLERWLSDAFPDWLRSLTTGLLVEGNRSVVKKKNLQSLQASLAMLDTPLTGLYLRDVNPVFSIVKSVVEVLRIVEDDLENLCVDFKPQKVAQANIEMLWEAIPTSLTYLRCGAHRLHIDTLSPLMAYLPQTTRLRELHCDAWLSHEQLEALLDALPPTVERLAFKSKYLTDSDKYKGAPREGFVRLVEAHPAITRLRQLHIMNFGREHRPTVYALDVAREVDIVFSGNHKPEVTDFSFPWDSYAEQYMPPLDARGAPDLNLSELWLKNNRHYDVEVFDRLFFKGPSREHPEVFSKTRKLRIDNMSLESLGYLLASGAQHFPNLERMHLGLLPGEFECRGPEPFEHTAWEHLESVNIYSRGVSFPRLEGYLESLIEEPNTTPVFPALEHLEITMTPEQAGLFIAASKAHMPRLRSLELVLSSWTSDTPKDRALFEALLEAKAWEHVENIEQYISRAHATYWMTQVVNPEVSLHTRRMIVQKVITKDATVGTLRECNEALGLGLPKSWPKQRLLEGLLEGLPDELTD